MRRRRVLQAAGATLLGTLAGCSGGGDNGDSTPAPEISGSWRSFGGDKANTGTGTGSATGPAASPAESWTVTADDEIGTSPIVVDGTVLAGVLDETLYALSLSDGTEEWTHSTDGGVRVPVAVASDVVFVAGNAEVSALDLASGDVYWTTEFDTSVAGGLVVADGTLYVPTRENLTALDAKTGESQWTARTGGAVTATPCVRDESVYFTSRDGNAYAVATEDGSVSWQTLVTTTGGFPSPTVADGNVYLGWGDGTLYVLSTADGTEQRTQRIGGRRIVAVADGTGYVAGYPLTSFALDTGETNWTTEEPDGITNSFALGTDRVYITTDDGHVVAYDRDSGAEQWRHRGQYGVGDPAAIADDRLVYGDEFGNVVALE